MLSDRERKSIGGFLSRLGILDDKKCQCGKSGIVVCDKCKKQWLCDECSHDAIICPQCGPSDNQD